MIKLNKAERKLAYYIARKRYESARSAGVVNSRMGPQSNEQTDLEGIAAEVAFCKAFNIYPDLEIDSVSFPDFDCVLSDGRSVDVKATRYESGRLIAAKWKKPESVDLYALMVGVFPEYRFAGVMQSIDLINPERLCQMPKGKAYAASQNELESI